MTEWRKVKLSDLISIKHGYAFKGEFFSEEETPYILVTPGNFNIGGGFKSDKFKWYKGEIPTDYILKKDDLIVTMTDLSKNGDTLGYSALVPELNGKMLLHNQRIGLVEFKSNDIDKYFLYWLMRTSVYQKSIVNTASGSTVKHTSPDRICQFSFLLPPLDIQRKIAGILGALDDKIEVLREQNKTLEQMAQAVFQSWFVDFDIVRAKAAGLPAADVCKKYHITPDIYDLFPSAFSADNLPLGWEKKKLEDMGMIVGGGTPSTENKEFFVSAGSSIPWITPKDLSGYTGKFISYGSTDISEKGLKESSAKLMPKGTVLFSSRAPIGYCVIAENDISTNQGFKSIVPNNSGYTEYLYQFLKNNIDMISGYATGSTFKEVSGSTMKQIPILKPADDILMEFEKMIYPLNQKNKENSKQIRTLEQTRDTLLPQLLSGKLDVENESLPSVNDEV